ncbi:preprotein translocase subunit SecG [Saccharicrinis fermentans]|uniref:Protein-export membrane protein SecG n=1 Tax=Saccharicrinis fermentans DSM 9555 = JCM 21142 TaxID=869213 RepID=W7YNL9_9BACT|nr:preprotein translocase subunit SecG [Saccharicrinis fermentans]GAF04024.1 preprotein translocase subunit SecG [Saccharicrinis fermentans DSM 9555 = JCM 21142]
MYPVVSVLVIVVSILLILIVLVQDSKGGGLASNFSASNQIMGVRKTTDFLGKATWYLAGGLLVLSLIAVSVIEKPGVASGDTELDEKLNQLAPVQSELPSFPAAGTDASTDENSGSEE